MVELLVSPQAQLPPEIACQVLSFLRVTWPHGFRDENRLRNWITREAHHPVSFALIEAGLLIAHAQVVWKMLDHAGQTYCAYGLTGVFTYPSFRGQGYGAQVVQAASDYIAGCPAADIGMFHCEPSLEAFYARCGWIAMQGAVTLLGPRQDPWVTDELMMMQFLSPKGRAGRESFLNEPVFFDEDDTW